MAQKLNENDGKDGWRDCEFAYLSRRLGQELKELRKLLKDNDLMGDDASLHATELLRNAIRREAADVANFAFMIADNVS